MQESKATPAAVVGNPGEVFSAAARDHAVDVRRIRESSRQRRLLVLAGVCALVLAYMVKRLLAGNPVVLGPPHFGPDAWIYLLPILLILSMMVVMLLPLANGRSPHVRFSPEQIEWFKAGGALNIIRSRTAAQ